MTLTRNQIERIITLIGIDTRIKSVTIKETNTSGIGVNHRAVFHYAEPGQGFEADLTDVSDW